VSRWSGRLRGEKAEGRSTGAERAAARLPSAPLFRLAKANATAGSLGRPPACTLSWRGRRGATEREKKSRFSAPKEKNRGEGDGARRGQQRGCQARHCFALLRRMQRRAPWGAVASMSQRALAPHSLQTSPLQQLCTFPPDPRVQLRIQYALSAAALHQPVQFGLYAMLDDAPCDRAAAAPAAAALEPALAFRAGEQVCMYGGVLRHSDDVGSACSSHARRIPDSDLVLDGLPLASLLRRPVPRTQSRLLQLCADGVQSLLPAEPRCSQEDVRRFFSSPLGFMSNTAEPQRCNVRVAQHSVPLGGGLTYQVPRFVATRDIRAGEEILCPYHSNEARLLRATASDAPPSSSSGVAGTSPARFQRYNLMQGAASHREGLAQQQANLYRFAADNRVDFQQLLYEPWQCGRAELSGGVQPPPLVQLRQSTLLPPLLGVFLAETLHTKQK
jgi:hypothetical protein